MRKLADKQQGTQTIFQDISTAVCRANCSSKHRQSCLFGHHLEVHHQSPCRLQMKLHQSTIRINFPSQGTSFVSFSVHSSTVPDMPIQNDYYRHTSLSWTRLHNRLASAKSQPPVVENEPSMNDVSRSSQSTALNLYAMILDQDSTRNIQLGQSNYHDGHCYCSVCGLHRHRYHRFGQCHSTE